MDVEIPPEAALTIINEGEWDRNNVEFCEALAECVRKDEPLVVPIDEVP